MGGMMFRFAAFALFTAIAFGQSNPFEQKPPAEVDAALKARVKEFFDFQVNGTPRKAEVLVAEDSKDLYYNDPKPKFFSCVFSRVDYTDRFTKAKVLMVCERNVMIPGAASLVAKVPTPSNWRIENGLWMYYLDPETMYPSPFGGNFKAGPMPPGQPGAAPAGPPIPSIESMTKAAMEAVKLDKNEVTLKVGDEAEIKINNTAPGPMKLALPQNPYGVEYKLDKDTVDAGGTVVLHLRAGETAASSSVYLEVEQTGQRLPIQITINRDPAKQ
jgi:hypothetical protein